MNLHKHGKSYRLRVLIGGKWKWKNLGRDYDLAVEQAEELLGISSKKLSSAIRRYKKEVLPKKAHATQVTQERQIDKLNNVFGQMDVDGIKPPLVIEYIDRRGKVSGNREVALLRHIITKCVHWGWLDYNPIMRLQYRFPEGKRDRVVTNKEIRFVMKQANARERYLIWLCYLTGLRREDAMSITDMNRRDGYIHVTESKTGKKVRIEETRSLKRVLDRLKPRYFTQISSSGIDTAWQRLRQQLKPDYDLFQLKDLRAAHAGVVEDAGGNATHQLGHSSSAVTQKHYIREGRKIVPIR